MPGGPSPPGPTQYRPIGRWEWGGLPPCRSTFPPGYGKKRAGGGEPVPNPSQSRREPVQNLSRTLPEPVSKPYLIKTLLVEFGESKGNVFNMVTANPKAVLKGTQ